MIDASTRQATFTVNGAATLHATLSDLDIDSGVYPCISLDVDALVKFNFGGSSCVKWESGYLQMVGLL